MNYCWQAVFNSICIHLIYYEMHVFIDCIRVDLRLKLTFYIRFFVCVCVWIRILNCVRHANEKTEETTRIESLVIA